MATSDNKLEAEVSLENQTLKFESISYSFEIDPAVKEKLLKGMDDIAESLSHINEIERFEVQHNNQLPV